MYLSIRKLSLIKKISRLLRLILQMLSLLRNIYHILISLGISYQQVHISIVHVTIVQHPSANNMDAMMGMIEELFQQLSPPLSSASSYALSSSICIHNRNGWFFSSDTRKAERAKTSTMRCSSVQVHHTLPPQNLRRHIDVYYTYLHKVFCSKVRNIK